MVSEGDHRVNPAAPPCTRDTSSLLRAASSASPPCLFRQRTRQFRAEEQHGPEARPDTGCVAVISGPESAPRLSVHSQALDTGRKGRGISGQGPTPWPWRSPSPLHPTHAPASAASPGPRGPPLVSPSLSLGPRPQPALHSPPNLPATNAAADPCCRKATTMQPGCILACV